MFFWKSYLSVKGFPFRLPSLLPFAVEVDEDGNNDGYDNENDDNNNGSNYPCRQRPRRLGVGTHLWKNTRSKDMWAEV